MARLRVIDSSDESDDSLPDLAALARGQRKLPPRSTAKKQQVTADNDEDESTEKEPVKAPATVRRRKLGNISDNALLRQWTPDLTKAGTDDASVAEERKPRTRRPRVAFRSRTSLSGPAALSEDQDGGYGSNQEDATIIEEVSLAEDMFDTADEDSSAFEDDLGDFIVDDSEEDESVVEVRPNPPKKPSLRLKARNPSQSKAATSASGKQGNGGGGQKAGGSSRPKSTRRSRDQTANEKTAKKPAVGRDLADTFSALKLNDLALPPPTDSSARQKYQDRTPPSTPPKTKPGLVSPKKLSRIPTTPHRPSTDMFWDQEFIDDWNDEHSPRKQLFPDPAKASPVKPAPVPNTKTVSARESKKAFEQIKHELAASFLRELDETITDGQLSQLSASTGGIKLDWSKKLNTTAGRANWKRETLRNAGPDGPPPKHYASIDLAEKVIDDEHRLLNVVAHEFCHLANFMISGVIKNPHGREFKVWASKTSRAFAHRGVEVTTKHSYDIDFKYVWQCERCTTEFKRHSKSIHPERHRCGRCKGLLVQIKPVPRGTGAAKDGCEKKGPSEYQVFMKEEMKRVRQENPGSPQKDIMKLVASKWSQRQGKPATPVVQEDANVFG
ncbi:SprT-like family-domain-containing protein [Podospora aff. communis PSN243]|uniref:SprT-like family-domain-containing protein n=1 Tax=Podospora aff. communis PSN243 TaxID=3040156 RepID=A0AAV9GA72_9PEZI|nr:SprT-like family-domain-containing protein [Podospora aff. communis PSN243]